MPNLEDLTRREYLILEKVYRIVGSMNEKAQQMIECEVFEAYRVLYMEYITLARQGDLEALKRAFFIQWYSANEPSCFSGIPNISMWEDEIGLYHKTEKTIFDLVAKWLDTDEELKWMVAWYYQISENYFAFWGEKPQIIEKIRKYIQEYSPLISKREFLEMPIEKRGQMGEYFYSILQSHMRHEIFNNSKL